MPKKIGLLSHQIFIYLLCLLLILIPFFFPLVAMAKPATKELLLEFIYFNSQDEMVIGKEIFTYSHPFTREEEATIIFTNLLDNQEEGKILFMPPSTILHSLYIKDNTLYLDVNEYIDTFKSSAMERVILGQMLLNAIPFSVERVSITINGESRPLSGGQTLTDIPVTDIFVLLPELFAAPLR